MQRELVLRAIEGDHDAFAWLVDASIDRLYAVAALIVGDRDRGRDAVQDAYLSAWRDRRALRDPDAWDAWLHRLTVWACYRMARQQRRRSLVELHVTADHVSGGELDPMAIVADRDLLERRLSGLPIEQRSAVVLRFYLDLPINEVAGILGIPVGTAKSRLHRALQNLHDLMRREPRAGDMAKERPA